MTPVFITLTPKDNTEEVIVNSSHIMYFEKNWDGNTKLILVGVHELIVQESVSMVKYLIDRV